MFSCEYYLKPPDPKLHIYKRNKKTPNPTTQTISTMETTPTVSTRPDSAEYTTSLRQLTKVLNEAWSSIMSDWANRSQEVTRLCNALFEFQDRFPVTLVFMPEILSRQLARFICVYLIHLLRLSMFSGHFYRPYQRFLSKACCVTTT